MSLPIVPSLSVDDCCASGAFTLEDRTCSPRLPGCFIWFGPTLCTASSKWSIRVASSSSVVRSEVRFCRPRCAVTVAVAVV